MTNAEIIHNTKLLNGVVEECHTFQEWKALGYQVKRGCKAVYGNLENAKLLKTIVLKMKCVTVFSSPVLPSLARVR